jgi:hypothetical protein
MSLFETLNRLAELGDGVFQNTKNDDIYISTWKL